MPEKRTRLQNCSSRIRSGSRPVPSFGPEDRSSRMLQLPQAPNTCICLSVAAGTLTRSSSPGLNSSQSTGGSLSLSGSLPGAGRKGVD